MTQRPLALWAAALLLCAAACTATPATAPAPTLSFSAIPDQNTALLQQRFEPVAAYLSAELGVPVRYVPATDYTASVEMFRNGDVQLAWFGGLTGVQARAAVPGARAIAQGEADKAYTSYFIAHRSTGLVRSETFPLEIADLTFAFGSRSSTSGRLMPEFYLRQASGKAPQDFFVVAPAYSGAHDKTATLVAAGKVQAGVLNYQVYDTLVANGTISADDAPIIWQTPPYADYNFTAHPDLDARYGPGFVDKLQQALLGMTDPALLDALGRKALISADNADYTQIEQVARDLEMLR